MFPVRTEFEGESRGLVPSASALQQPFHPHSAPLSSHQILELTLSPPLGLCTCRVHPPLLPHWVSAYLDQVCSPSLRPRAPWSVPTVLP